MPKVDLFKEAVNDAFFKADRYNEDQTAVENAINSHDDTIAGITAKADNAVSTANTASTNASNAVTTANSANTKADNAVSTANTAATNASNAVTTANSAKTTAETVQADYNTIKPQLEAAVQSVADKADVAYVDEIASDFQMGVVLDNSLTNTKLGSDIKIGSLETLTTTEKGSVVGAVNELDADVGDKSTLITTEKGSLVGAVNELVTKNGTKLDSTQTLPTINITANGVKATVPIDSATTIAPGEILYMSSTGYKKAKGDAAATMPATVLALEAGTGGNRTVLLFGFFKNTAWNYTKGARGYVSPSTAGAVMATQPSTTGQQIQDVGCFVANDTLFFNPNAVFIEK